jgi:seryl-tRNA synthetase
MIQVAAIREDKERIIIGLKKRNFKDDQLLVIDDILEIDDNRKKTQSIVEVNFSEQKKLAAEIGDLMKQGKREEAESIKSKVSTLKEDAKQLEISLEGYESKLEDLLLNLPNIPHISVPYGKVAEDNEVFQDWIGELPTPHADAVPHWELAEKYNIFSLELGVKITGAGFPLYRGKGAKMQRALINFFLDEANKAGFEEIQTPILVNEASARGTGQIPDKEGQMYYIEKDDLYLIPTAEVPVTNIYRDEIVRKEDLPIRLTGYTPCFRREAGSYGAHVRGLNRVHQFDKVEIVQFIEPEKSYDALMGMVDHIKGLMEKLELPYRILRLCGGDMGSASALTFDFEAFSVTQQRWLEVSSVSNFETYQTNRMKARYRDEDGKIKLMHSLNGSALALPRILASLLEMNQTSEGIVIPKALRPYTGFDILN